MKDCNLIDYLNAKLNMGAKSYSVLSNPACCPKCAKVYKHGTIWFDINDLKYFPPLHPNCRCTTAYSTKTAKKKNSNERDIKNPESRDYSQGTNEDGFNKDNVDFKDLKENLNKIHDDPVLVDNAIRHIKETIGSTIEFLWETGNGNRIIIRKDGEKSFVYLSKSLISRARRGGITTQMIHNHTSGTPLPHPEDMVNLLKYKVRNSGITGNYGYLNMKNSFKKLNFTEKELDKLRIKGNEMFAKLKNNAFAHNPGLKQESKYLKNMIRYKYNKENITNIVNEYNKFFKEYGIEFDYVPYKLK
ncbi:MAG: hypothetical protein FWH29_01155 [Methanobrevibacter sp.]|nr:hypothetical protein [Methanobrevibacter sp.]